MKSLKLLLSTKNRGFTIIEVIIIFAIIGVLAAIAIPSINFMLQRTREAADDETLKSLNTATIYYASQKAVTNNDIFNGITTDTARMQALVDIGVLGSAPTPQQKNKAFTWDKVSQKWILTDSSSPGGGGTETYPSWSSSENYNTGATVSYNGSNFYARYYASSSDVPGTLGSPWQEITTQWRDFNVYNAGDTVTYGGASFTARYYSYNQQPGLISSPWQESTSEWRNFNVYNAGDTVTYNGDTYVALTYSQNVIPGTNALAWKNTSNTWQAGNAYHTGDTVTYNGATYTARNYTVGQQPGLISSPWQEVTTEWRNFNVYNAGDTVTYNGHQYRANWYNQNTVPTGQPYTAWSLVS